MEDRQLNAVPRSSTPPPGRPRATRIEALLAGCLLAVLLAGCSTMDVTTDYDPGAVFEGMKRYAWLPEPRKATGDPRIDDNKLLDQRIRKAVEDQLEFKGYTLSTSDPDFLVGYHVSLDKRQSVQVLNDYYGYGPGWGYRYGAAYRPMGYAGAPDTYVYEYEEGTLILDIVNPANRELMWRGAASDEVHFKNTPQESEAQIRTAVQAMLERFPPDANR